MRQMFRASEYNSIFTLFLTQCSTIEKADLVQRIGTVMDREHIKCGRIGREDLYSAIGPVQDRGGLVAYVCGVPSMTDEFVGLLREAEGMQEERVLCEKWW